MELKEIRKIYRQELSKIYPLEEIDSFFYLSVEHYLNLERFVLVLQPHISLTKKEEQPLFECLSRLKNQEPIQYILGEVFFYGLRFFVDESVLIPRPETEELVHWILEDSKKKPLDLAILDIGTGSGCIAIALSKNIPGASVFAIDNSEAALKISKRNADFHGVNVRFTNEDISQPNVPETKYDIIVSNPPYVRVSEKSQMKGNVTRYEPHEALFVSDEAPLYYYHLILNFAKTNLKENGLLYLEVNQYLAKNTAGLLEEEKFSEIELRKDLFGNDRMIRAIWR
ncbi:MAG: peptide chain release factor N(5)-glutamine methyltransferase [Flavobacteriaceae bacterium]